MTNIYVLCTHEQPHSIPFLIPSETKAQTDASEMRLPNEGQTEVKKKWNPNRPKFTRREKSGKVDGRFARRASKPADLANRSEQR